MARKRYSDEDILKLLREMEIYLSSGSDISSACRSVGISPSRHLLCNCLPGNGRNLLQLA
jgi:hypothetical protein